MVVKKKAAEEAVAEAPKKAKKEAIANHKGVYTTPKGLSTETEERKVTRDEVIQLQKEGKLMGFNPATQIGIVRVEGHPTRWPGGACEADRNLA